MKKIQKVEAERFVVAQLCDIIKEVAFATRAKRKQNVDLYLDYGFAIGATSVITAEEHEKLDFDDYWKVFKEIATNMEKYIDVPFEVEIEFSGDTVDDYIKIRRKK
jgi:hypothetical protein